MSSKRPSNSPAQEQSKKKAKTQASLSGFFATASKSSSPADTTSSGYKIFCDLDGVLVDFETGVKQIFNGRPPNEINQGMMWGAISKADQFYTSLPWCHDGKALWEELKNIPGVDILTGVPRHNSSRVQKFAWCKKELGVHGVNVNHVDMAGKKSAHELVAGRRKKGVVNVITCWSKNKHLESKANHILIDDRLSLRDAWEKKGGIFIHHTNTESTLRMLRERGVLEESKPSANQVEDMADCKL